jgi:hypothetical protein
MRVLAARAGLSDRYGLVVAAGVDKNVAFLEGQEVDDSLLGKAFGENWTLDARYPTELPGLDFCSAWTRRVFVVLHDLPGSGSTTGHYSHGTSDPTPDQRKRGPQVRKGNSF